MTSENDEDGGYNRMARESIYRHPDLSPLTVGDFIRSRMPLYPLTVLLNDLVSILGLG